MINPWEDAGVLDNYPPLTAGELRGLVAQVTHGVTPVVPARTLARLLSTVRQKDETLVNLALAAIVGVIEINEKLIEARR